MKSLVALTNASPGLEQEIAEGKHQRLDYVELARHMSTTFTDDSLLPENKPVLWLEKKLRMNFRLAWQVAQIVKRDHYDAVVSLSESVGIPLTYLLPRQVKHLVIMHHPLSPSKLRLIQALQVPHRFDKILVLSHAEADALADKLGFRHDEIGVLRFPTDTQFYQPPAETPSLSQQDHIESLGASYRDYPTLMRAMKKLPHIPCYVRVGSLWTKDVSGDNDASLPDNVQLQPYVPPIKLRDCYTHSRFIVVPIRDTTHWSAGSATVQQAQAMGKAVIATRLPGLSEYVLDGETGILVDIGDDKAMAEAINELWNNPQKAEAMGRRAREWIVSNFSLDQWVNQISDYLKP